MTVFAPPPEIIRLATQNPYPARLEPAGGTAEKRSPLCGSKVIVDVTLDDGDRVAAIGTRVNACAFGQAAATLMAEHAVGRSVAELVATRAALAAWIAGEGEAPDWPGIEHLRPDRLNLTRKGSVQLAFQAVAEAALAAQEARAHA